MQGRDETWRIHTKNRLFQIGLKAAGLLIWLIPSVSMAQTPNCSGLTNTSLTSLTVCSGTTVGSLQVNAIGLSGNEIEFVRFDTLYANPYKGNNRAYVGDALPVAGKVTLQNVLFPENWGASDRIYYVYALLKNEPTDPQCRPFALITVYIRANPTAVVIIKEATCYGGETQHDGQVLITGYDPTDTYEMAVEGTFTGQAKAVPAEGIIVDGISRTGTAKSYAVRIYNSFGCHADRSISMTNAKCDCPPIRCTPIVISRTRSHRVHK